MRKISVNGGKTSVRQRTRGKGNGQRSDYFVINENVSASNNPLSLSLREGITNNAMNDKVMKGAERDDPNDLAIVSIAV